MSAAVGGDCGVSRSRVLRAAWLTCAFFICVAAIGLASGLERTSWFAWVLMLPLFAAIRVLPPFPAFLAGFAWGLAYFLALCVGADATLVSHWPQGLALTLVPGLYAAAGAALTRRVGFSPLLLGLGWVGVEFLLAPLHFEQGIVAATLGNGLVVRTLGRLAGYVLVAFLVAYVNASIIEMLAGVYRLATADRRLPVRTGSAVRKLIPFEHDDCRMRWAHTAQPRAPPL